MRLVEIKNEKLVEILKERAELHKELGDINENLMALDKERTKNGYKMDKLKEKTKVIMDKLNPKLEEFEVISRVYLEKGKPVYEVIDMIEEYKKQIRESKKKK
jgi:signal recognition particle subunit SEC65